MKKYILFLLLIFVSFDAKQDAYDAWVNGLNSESIMVLAGYATREVKDAVINNKKSSMLWVRLYDRYVSFFFKVDDLYESYIDKSEIL
jgi:hypothetical protein